MAESPSQPVPSGLSSRLGGYNLAVISQGCVEVSAGKHLCGTHCVVRDSIYKLDRENLNIRLSRLSLPESTSSLLAVITRNFH